MLKMKKKIITIIGARPQIIKSSAVSRIIHGKYSNLLEEIIVHTGQHYDENMSEVFFNEMNIPKPKYNLNVGSGLHGEQTAKMIDGLEKIYLDEQPDAVIVYGDTNSTLAASLAASKINIPVIHIEAGLRSFNKSMPEEINRIACDHMSTLLFSPTTAGINNLRSEGFDVDKVGKATINSPTIYQFGDIMFDNSLFFSSVSDQKSAILNELSLAPNSFILCTIHRDANTDHPENLSTIFNALLEISKLSQLKIVLPLHPRTKNKMEELMDPVLLKSIENSELMNIIPPTGFLDIIALEKNAALIITDSGGLQKEAFFFQKPCVILREQTEWVEIVENGNAILAEVNEGKIIDAFNHLSTKKDFTFPNFYGNGKTAELICEKIMEDLLC